MMQAAREAGAPAAAAVLIGLANGFLQYVTTAEEYSAQHYEGGSVLYGSGSAGLLERRLGELAGMLSVPGSHSSPPAEVGPIIAYPGRPRSIMPLPGPEPAGPVQGPIHLSCAGGRLSARWYDLMPGRLLPRESPWVALERAGSGGAWVRVAVDGDGALEISAVRARGIGFEWRAAWRGTAEPGRYRLVRLADSVAVERISEPAACP
jgi:neutral ceramidase